MIDLTPLDVRNKRGDFKKLLRGYDPQEVDTFLELVADRLEDLVREAMLHRERLAALEQQVASQSGRERAVQEALVTAQELRAEIKGSAQREADLILAEAQAEARRQLAEAEAQVRSQLRDADRRLEVGTEAIEEMEKRRTLFLKAYRQLLERELNVVDVEEDRPPLEERAIDLDLGGGRSSGIRDDVERLFTEQPLEDVIVDEAPLEDPLALEPPPSPPALPADEALQGLDEAALAAAAEVGVVKLTPPAVEERHPLDMTVDELAAAYPPSDEEGEEQPDTEPPVGDRGLFALPDPDDAGDEDSRWG